MEQNILHPAVEMTLIAECQKGDRQAFNRLVIQYQHLVYNFLYRLAPNWDDLDDLAQEVFVKVYHSIHRLKDQTHFLGWLHRIAVRVYIDERRRRRKREARFISDESVLQSQPDPRAYPDQHLERHELQRQLQHALDQLPEEFKVAFVLREIQGLSYDEIAKVLTCSPGTVRSRIFRARQQLQHLLREQDAPLRS